jgi:hypothetical protein
MSPKDRRNGSERRTAPPAEGNTRKGDRRMGDRRDSPRVPMKILVRQVELGGSFEERSGDIGVGGVFFEERSLPIGREVELRFRLPGLEHEVRCRGEVVLVSQGPGKSGGHVRFVDLPTEVELAVARFIDDQVLKRS